ncbi:MAG: YSC84-related protein [Acidiferrobacterales bacterium]
MKTLAAFTLTMFGFVAFSPLTTQAGWDPRKDAQLLKRSEDAIAAFKKRDPSLKAFFKQAYGYVVFPKITKGGLIIGGAHGRGVVYRKGKTIGRASISQGTFGLQAGGKTYRQIIFFKDEAALKRLLNGSLEFAAQATANAVRTGAAAEANYRSGVAVFSMATGGAMAEVSIGGQKFEYTPTQ